MILPKISGYVKTFKVKNGDKDKNKKLISFGIYDEKLLEKYKTIWTKTADLKNIELNALPVYDDRYIKAKIRTYGDKVYTYFCCLNVPEDDIECKYFTVIFTDSLLLSENKYYLHVHLSNCPYRAASKQMIDYLDYNLFETD